ncbi:hypothetical protein JCM19037_3407 [Geomicrobium sp. JCM 19037]|uniref:sulfite exporter TauE/SafE family protein n=1 Tax=Geomicrobium sp. JCM 19037 TaxID=1460634 RepID=UPI00045F40EE|nr:sulfite exporter TauE/SafE family protein [Geomicrobium sp. JCM 19037]GAK04948.1 hypothetical protein JCM19037_3407 [Geomicrobium sp. JCM 19037]
MSILIFTIIGILIGVLSSLFGLGGGLIVVPILFALLPESIPASYLMHTAIGTSLAVMIINSLNSTLNHSRQNNVKWPIFRFFVLTISMGAFVGGVIASYVPSDGLRYVFIAFLIYVIISNVAKRTFTNAFTEHAFTYPKKSSGAISGIVIGFVSTLLGIGGSLMTIPYLRKRGLRMLHAVALATPLGLPIAIVGSITYLITGLQAEGMPDSTVGFIYFPALLGFTLGGFAGVPLGRIIAQKLPDGLFSKIYLLLLVLVVLMMIFG